MDAVKERKVMKWAEPDHKLTDEEIHVMLETFDYDTWLAEFDEDGESMPVYDMFGNPTRDTFAAMYEDEHGLGEAMTLDELFADWDMLRAEVEDERNKAACAV